MLWAFQSGLFISESPPDYRMILMSLENSIPYQIAHCLVSFWFNFQNQIKHSAVTLHEVDFAAERPQACQGLGLDELPLSAMQKSSYTNLESLRMVEESKTLFHCDMLLNIALGKWLRFHWLNVRHIVAFFKTLLFLLFKKNGQDIFFPCVLTENFKTD